MNLFDFYIPEEILVALSLFVLVVVLRRFFWKPVITIIDNRQKSVGDMLQGAEDAKRVMADVEEKRARHDAEMEHRIAEKTKEARERAAREYDRIIAEAEEKAHRIVEAGEEKARRSYDQSMAEARDAVVMLALGAASVIVESSMDSEKNRELIEVMLQKAGVSHD
jgi:F-type H+-transporting ATPase subunit b